MTELLISLALLAHAANDLLGDFLEPLVLAALLLAFFRDRFPRRSLDRGLVLAALSAAVALLVLRVLGLVILGVVLQRMGGGHG